jgi:hypothetical protein
MLSCGIGARMQKIMMTYLLHLASILPILMNFGDPLLKSDRFWLHSFYTYKLHLIYWWDFHQNHKLWNNPSHHNWFKGRKNLYCMNNLVVVDHYGLFIYLDLGYLRSYHDVNIFCQLNIHKSWCQCFVPTYEYFKGLLGYLGYMSEEIFVMRHIGRCELARGIYIDAIRA